MQLEINAEEFLDAFRIADSQMRDQLSSAYGQSRTLTQRLLGNKPLRRESLLERVCEEVSSRLGKHFEYHRETYTIDAAFYSGEELLFPGDAADGHGNRLWYPSRLPVIIEHENKLEAIKEEMWKLLFWRAGLKVLISHDAPDDEHQQPVKRGNEELKGEVATHMLKKLRQMLEKVHGGKEIGSEYLLILGNRKSASPDMPVRWRWCRIDIVDQHLQPLTDA